MTPDPIFTDSNDAKAKLSAASLRAYIDGAERILRNSPDEITDLEEERDWLFGLRDSGLHGAAGQLPAYLRIVSHSNRTIRVQNSDTRLLSLRAFHRTANPAASACKVGLAQANPSDDEPLRMPPGTAELVSDCPWSDGSWLEVQIGGPGVPPNWISDSMLVRRIQEIETGINSRRQRLELTKQQLRQFKDELGQIESSSTQASK